VLAFEELHRLLLFLDASARIVSPTCRENISVYDKKVPRPRPGEFRSAGRCLTLILLAALTALLAALLSTLFIGGLILLAWLFLVLLAGLLLVVLSALLSALVIATHGSFSLTEEISV
jgi:hypothetical protein